MINLYSDTIKKIRIVIISILILVSTSYNLLAQGWSFNAQLVYTGYCPYQPNAVLPTITGFKTQAECESTRQYVLSLGYTGSCGFYFKCTPCTGADIVDPNTISPGNVSTDGKLEGKPLFTPHANKAMEDYGENYKQSKESLKNNQKLKIDTKSSTYGIKRVPVTGNKKLDESYSKKSKNWNILYSTSPKGKKVSTNRSDGNITKGYEIGDPSVVDLTGKKGIVDPNDLTSSKQQAETEKWNKEHNIVYSQIPANEGLTDANGNPVMGYDEAGIRVWLDNQDGLRGIIAAFAMNVLDGDIDLLNKAINVIQYGSPEEQSKLANEVLSGSIAINAAKKTAYDKTIGAMVDVGKNIFGLNKLLKTVNGAEEVHDVIQFGIDVEEKRNGN